MTGKCVSKPKYSQLKNAEKCTHCGYCLPVCPTYQVENEEMQSPRGRVSIVLALIRGAIQPSDAVDALSHCIGCRACHQACPVGVRPGKLSLAARALDPIPSTPMGQWLHGITDSHAKTALATRLLDWYVRGGVQRIVRPLLRLVPPLSRKERLIPAHRPPVPVWLPEPAEDAPVVALLGGCMARLFLPHVGMSARALLQSLGFRVVTPQGFGCCGAPHRERGDKEAFMRQAKATLDAFGDLGAVEAVICDSSVCTVTARSFGKAVGKREKAYTELAKQFSDKVLDLTEFLDRYQSQWQQAAEDPGMGRLAFQDHCQMRHGLGTYAEPRSLLNALPVAVEEIAGDGACCGAGGEYMVRYPQRSRLIRKEKLDAIEATGAQTVVATNPGCILNTQAGLEEAGHPTKVRHLAEVLWRAREKQQPRVRQKG
ncbi:(Fe-S)-binding protein [Magnetococcus sp. PR-3]|uniref:(Fe-S)-binding protein n=1 Tax=Magnetococcus sp. PR-3 TaxID=3120355 RepID=UPI002FCE39AC